MELKSFKNIIQKIADERGVDIFFEPKRLRPVLLDYTENEFEVESNLLLSLLNTDYVKYISDAENIAECKQYLVEQLEDKHKLSLKRSIDTLDILFHVLLWRWPVRVFKSPDALVNSIAAFTPDSKSIVTVAFGGGFDRILKLWNAESEQLICALEGHSKAVSSVTFSPDGKRIISGSYDNTIKLWNAENGQLIRTFEGHDKAVLSVAFSPDSKCIISGSDDNTLKLWNTENGQIIRTFEEHDKAVLSVAFSPDGKYIISGSDDNFLKLWNAENGQIIRTFERHGKPVSFLAFSPNGKLIVSGSSFDIKLKLWETETGKLVRVFGHGQNASSVSFSPDGKFIIAKSNLGANTLTIWEAENGRLFRTFKAQGRGLLSAVFNQNNSSGFP